MTTINFSLGKPVRQESISVNISLKEETRNESKRKNQKQFLNFSVQSKESTSKSCSPQSLKLIYLNEEIESDSKGEKNKKMKGNKNTEKKDWLHVNEDLEGNFKSTTKIEQSTHEKSHRNESLCSTKQEMSAEHLPNIEMMRGNEKQVNDEMNSTLSLHGSKNDNIKQGTNSAELADIQHFSNQIGTPVSNIRI